MADQVVEFYLDGDTITSIYTDDFDVRHLGNSQLIKASYIHVDENNLFYVDLSPIDGPVLPDRYTYRRDAIAAEINWINKQLTTGSL